MKQLLLLLITLTLFGSVSGQKIEFSASLNSGLFSFTGDNVVGTTFLQTGPNSIGKAYIANSMGSKGGLCYGLSLNLKKVVKQKYFFGVDIGYEVLRSRAKITEVVEHTYDPSVPIWTTDTHNITGNAFSNNTFVNTNPFVGYRCKYKKINFDATIGMDIGYYLKFSESGNAKKTDGTNYDVVTFSDFSHITTDFRPRLQLSSGYKKIGVHFGYAYGISNYIKPYMNGYRPLVTSKIFRFGVTYRIR